MRGLYHQATRKTEREQLASLSQVIAQQFDDPALRRLSFEAWEDVLCYCAERVGNELFAIVLDEFPYLADAAPTLPSIVQAIWDHELEGTRIKLILLGHLTLLDPPAPLIENVVRQILDPTARLHEGGAHAFDASLGDAEVHYSIIDAITNGEVQCKTISNRTGKKSASLSRPLEWLKEMEVIEQIRRPKWPRS